MWVLACFVALVMLIQYHGVHVQKETPGGWPRVISGYRNRVRFVCAALIFGSLLVICTCAIFYFMYGESPNPQKTHDRLNKLIFPGDLPGTVLLWTFFLASIRLFIDKTDSDDKIFGSPGLVFRSFISHEKFKGELLSQTLRIPGNTANNSWMWWFFLSLPAAALDEYFIKSAFDNTGGKTFLDTLFFAGALTLLIIFSYFSWIYMILYRKLVDTHNFTDRAARIFLGGIFTGNIPHQAVLIGPAGAGKTTFGFSKEYVSATEITQSTTRAISRAGKTYDVTIVDLPGEQMGDHIMFPLHFRADTLVLVLSADFFDRNALRDRRNYDIERWDNLIEEGKAGVRDYLRGLNLATRRGRLVRRVDVVDTEVDVVDMEAAASTRPGTATAGASSDTSEAKSVDRLDTPPESAVESDASTMFKVRSFVLYINVRPAVNRSGGAFDAEAEEEFRGEAMQRLARQVGERFGVKEGSHCCCIVGNAAVGGNAYELLAVEPGERIGVAARPEGRKGQALDG